MQTMRTLVASAAALLMSATAFGQLKQSDIEKLNEATGVLGELRNTAEGGIPDSLFSKAHCVVVIPDLKKAGFILGGEHGSGVMSCRRGNTWSPPVFMDLTKGSAGLQIGVQSTDLVLLVMNQSGADKLLRNKVTLGGDASVAAGPVGRAASAGTDAQLSAEMLSYSRAHGVFAGLDLSGGVLRPDNKASAAFYGHDVSDRDVLSGSEQPVTPSSARSLMAALNSGLSHKPSKHGA